MGNAIAREVTYHPQILTDLLWWKSHDMEMGVRVVSMLEHSALHPTVGLGMPKRIRTLPRLWSRRVNMEHRIFYLLHDDAIRFLSCRGHDLPQHLYAAIRDGDEV